MPKVTAASDEAIIDAVRSSQTPTGDGPLSWAPFAIIKAHFPDENEQSLLERLQKMAAGGVLSMSFAWRDHRAENKMGVNPIVGYCKDNPLFRVL